MTPEQIAALFKKCADDTGDVLPVLVFELESPSASFDLSCFPGLSEAVAAYVSGSLTDSDPAPKDRGITKVEMSLDELLDIVNKGGIEALTSEQKELLNKLSSEL
jgi:hypothetical protein